MLQGASRSLPMLPPHKTTPFPSWWKPWGSVSAAESAGNEVQDLIPRQHCCSLQGQLHLAPLGVLWRVEQAAPLLCLQAQSHAHPLSVQKGYHHSCTPKRKIRSWSCLPSLSPTQAVAPCTSCSQQHLPGNLFSAAPSWSFKYCERLPLKFLHRNHCSTFNTQHSGKTKTLACL